MKDKDLIEPEDTPAIIKERADTKIFLDGCEAGRKQATDTIRRLESENAALKAWPDPAEARAV